MTIHIIKIPYQELNVGHQVLAPGFFFVEKLTPTIHSCFFLCMKSSNLLKLWFICSCFEIVATFPFSLDWAKKTMFPLSSDLGWSYRIEKLFMALLVCIGYDVIHYICLLQISGNDG